jgi:hypothetical protein
MELNIEWREKIRPADEGFPFLPGVSQGDTDASRLVI